MKNRQEVWKCGKEINILVLIMKINSYPLLISI